MDVTSGEIEEAMDQGASDVSGSMRWIREHAMDQATSDGSGSNRVNDGCYNRKKRKSDGSWSKLWIREQ